MRKSVTAAAALLAVGLSAVPEVHAADQTYLAVRGGMFLPNGKGGGDPQGFKSFDTGYSVDVAAGYRPESYVAIEVGTGFYSASGKDIVAEKTTERTAYGVPVTLSAKGILEFEKIMLSGGAGVGYYFGFIDTSHTNSTTATSNFSQSSHGAALGYQLLFDADFKVAQNWTVGANFKWFQARPEIETKDPVDYATKKQKWEIGGLTFSAGAKYFF